MSLQPDHLDKALALSVTSCVTLGKLLDLSEPQFPFYETEIIIAQVVVRGRKAHGILPGIGQGLYPCLGSLSAFYME